MNRILAALVLASLLAAGDADPLAKALALADGDPFARDAMETALAAAPAGKRADLVVRLDASGRDDVNAVLHRLIQDEDPDAAAAAIDALARRWPTDMRDVEIVRLIIPRSNAAGAAACRYAAAVRDDEAIEALCDRQAMRADDQPSEQALRRLLGLPAGCGPEGWHEVVAKRRGAQETALAKAERLVEGAEGDAIAAVTLVAGMRPIPARGERVLLAALEHPERAVRASAAAILSTCEGPMATAWRARREGAEAATGGPVVAASSSPSGTEAASARPSGPVPAAIPAGPAATAPSSGGGFPLVLLAGVVIAAVLWLVLRRRAGSRAGD